MWNSTGREGGHPRISICSRSRLLGGGKSRWLGPESRVSLIMRTKEAKAGAQAVSNSADLSGELNVAVFRKLSVGDRRESAGAEAMSGFGRPTPVTAPERRSGVWSTHRLDEPTRCSRNEGCHGGEDI